MVDTVPSSSRLRNPDQASEAQTAVVGSGLGGQFPAHALGLLTILLFIFPFVVKDTVWSADIGARLYQAQHLMDTGTWTVAHPLPRADPDGVLFPLHLSTTTAFLYQYIVFPKHPALVWMTAGVFGYAGLPGLVLIQTLSTVAAAVGTARLVARSRPSLAVATLWFTGLLSPLFFDAFIGYSHSLAAALLIWAAVFTLQFVDPRPIGSRPNGAIIVVAGLLVALACFARTEAALAGVAMAGGAFVVGIGRWSRVRWLAAVLTIGASTVAAVVLDRFMIPGNTGVVDTSGYDSWGGLIGRIEGFQRTWLSPGRTEADIVILLIAVIVIATGVLASQRLVKPITGALVVAVVLAVARAVAEQPVLVFGLVAACPLLLVGLIRGVPLARTNPESLFGAVTFGLFSMAVLATQYRYGGVAEWGGRYFAAGIPFAIAVAIPGLAKVLAPIDRENARRLALLAAAAGLIINLAGLRSLVGSRNATEAMVSEIAASMAEVRNLNLESAVDNGLAFADGDVSKPVVVTTINPAARLSWDIVDDGTWLLVEPERLENLAERLNELEVPRFTLFTNDANEDLAQIREHYTVESWIRSDFAPGDVIIVSAAD